MRLWAGRSAIGPRHRCQARQPGRLSSVSVSLAIAKPQASPGVDLRRQRDLFGVGHDVEQGRSVVGQRCRGPRRSSASPSVTRTACSPQARATAARSTSPSSVPNSGSPACSCSSLTIPSRPLLKTTSLTGSWWWTAVMQVAEQHRQPAVAAERDHLAAAVQCLRAERLGHRVGHRAEVVGAEQPPVAAHRHEPRQPYGRHPGVAGEDRVVGGVPVDRRRRPPRAGSGRRGCRTPSGPSRRSPRES